MLLGSGPCSCGKMLYRKEPLETLEMIFQHGENPEHVYVVSPREQAMLDAPADRTLFKRIEEWCERIHAYERLLETRADFGCYEFEAKDGGR